MLSVDIYYRKIYNNKIFLCYNHDFSWIFVYVGRFYK